MSGWGSVTTGIGSIVGTNIVPTATAPAPAPTDTTVALPPPPVIPTAPTVNANGFTDTQQSAFDILNQMLSTYGLGSLAGTLKGIILGGITDQNEISLKLQSTDEWKTRFAGNELLKQAGLPVLDVAQYLSVEQSYAQVMKNYGLPQGFYDDPSDFAKWIGNSVSPNEIQQRAQMYSDLVKREDPAVIDQLSAMGLSEGDILAHLMDPSRALPLLQQKVQTTLIGAAARRAGLTPDTAYMQHLADLGVTEGAAVQGFGEVAAETAPLQKLGDIYNDNISQTDLMSETFEGNGQVTQKKKRLASQERAAFSGSAGVGQGSLGRNNAGSY